MLRIYATTTAGFVWICELRVHWLHSSKIFRIDINNSKIFLPWHWICVFQMGIKIPNSNQTISSVTHVFWGPIYCNIISILPTASSSLFSRISLNLFSSSASIIDIEDTLNYTSPGSNSIGTGVLSISLTDVTSIWLIVLSSSVKWHSMTTT